MIQKMEWYHTRMSPLAHNSDEAMGVDAKFRRMLFQASPGNVRVPVHSGNAFRGKTRRIAALDFLNSASGSMHREKSVYPINCITHCFQEALRGVHIDRVLLV